MPQSEHDGRKQHDGDEAQPLARTLHYNESPLRKKAPLASRIGTHYVYWTPHGPVTIAADERGVTHVAFGDVSLSGERRPSALTSRTANQLLEYFAGKRRVFDVPLTPEGTAFQLAVWREVERIPFGETLTAADVAALLDRPDSYRAVGSAVHQNPLAVLVPDHRIVGANGAPIGAHAKLRGALLTLERERTMDAH